MNYLLMSLCATAIAAAALIYLWANAMPLSLMALGVMDLLRYSNGFRLR